MAYRFNNGRGAVTCDACYVIIDEDLSGTEYKECYNGATSGYEGDFCLDCIKGINKPQIDDDMVVEQLKRRQEAHG